MLHRAAVSDKALGLLMDRCRATFANTEPDGSFTLYADTGGKEPVKYRVPVKMHRLAQRCLGRGARSLRTKIDPVPLGSCPSALPTCVPRHRRA